MIASYYSVFWKWEFFLLFLHLFNRITSSSFQQIKKKASKKSDFVILLCSIAHPVPGNACTYSQNTGNLLQYFMNCKDWNALQCRILLHTQQWCGKKYVSTMDSCTNSMSPVSTSYIHLNLEQHSRLFWFICFWIKLPQK